LRLAIGILVIFVTLVLNELALIADINPGFIKDYYILLLNTSTLSQNLIQTPINEGNKPSPTSYGPLSGVIGKLYTDAITAVRSAIISSFTELSTVENDITNKPIEKIGIQQ
ncbi:hypothetical protein QBC43DRAFT_223229, partial [Cladorrhinum sp. PSN259]